MINTKEPKDTNETLDAIVQEARAFMSDEELIEFIAKLERLESLLKSHDWYYMYSDDHSVWKKGVSEREAIGQLTAQLLYVDGMTEVVNALYQKYSN